MASGQEPETKATGEASSSSTEGAEDVKIDATGRLSTQSKRVAMANSNWGSIYADNDCVTPPTRGKRVSFCGDDAEAIAESLFISEGNYSHSASSEDTKAVCLEEEEVIDSEHVGVDMTPLPSFELCAGVSKDYQGAIRLRRTSLGLDDWPPLLEGHDPDDVWERVKDKQLLLDSTAVYVAGEPPPPQEPGFCRFVCISDTHGNHEELNGMLPQGDVLLHSGGFSMTGQEDEVVAFAKWLGAQAFEQKVVIAGSHDTTFHADFYNSRGGQRLHGAQMVNPDDVRAAFLHAAGSSVYYLQDESHFVHGIHIYGSPWQPDVEDWAFCVNRGPPLARKWSAIPPDTDVLLVHGPPLGRGDLKNGVRSGCADLLAAVQYRVNPAFCVSGHTHEGYGASFNGKTHFINATSVDDKYRVVNPPLVFDLPRQVEEAG